MSRFKVDLSTVAPDTPATIPPKPNAAKADRLASENGFPSREPTVRRRLKPPPAVPTDQLNLRVPVDDINAFVAWCEFRGFRLRDGFTELVRIVCREEG
jgi:hypothetical protein